MVCVYSLIRSWRSWHGFNDASITIMIYMSASLRRVILSSQFLAGYSCSSCECRSFVINDCPSDITLSPIPFDRSGETELAPFQRFTVSVGISNATPPPLNAPVRTYARFASHPHGKVLVAFLPEEIPEAGVRLLSFHSVTSVAMVRASKVK
ncbi:hypothetical protein BV22DRAFT_92257 [Leucogyrophana mollusca]|uniref:Uncharacterized protein n=1 Tax=Leucogyrophana mollusca TaxID=85980 RepID=A0ACB8BXQ5_9AGAM|nr:hypothetical protein BV22DRAFT_92257 [Leucogyrophana mollusca]